MTRAWFRTTGRLRKQLSQRGLVLVSGQHAPTSAGRKQRGNPGCKPFVCTGAGLVSSFCKIDEFCLKASADRRTDPYLL